MMRAVFPFERATVGDCLDVGVGFGIGGILGTL